MQRTLKTIVLTTTDYERLRKLLAQNGHHRGVAEPIQTLERELNRAALISPHHLPNDVVSMNSKVRVRGGNRAQADTWTIVYPDDADIDQGRISVLSPAGLALLGYRAGDDIAWDDPVGPRRFQIEEVIYQPEAAGQYDL